MCDVSLGWVRFDDGIFVEVIRSVDQHWYLLKRVVSSVFWFHKKYHNKGFHNKI